MFQGGEERKADGQWGQRQEGAQHSKGASIRVWDVALTKTCSGSDTYNEDGGWAYLCTAAGQGEPRHAAESSHAQRCGSRRAGSNLQKAQAGAVGAAESERKSPGLHTAPDLSQDRGWQGTGRCWAQWECHVPCVEMGGGGEGETRGQRRQGMNGA